MIFHFGQPLVFLAMGLGFVIAVLVHNLAQTLTARALGDPVARMSRRRILDPKREFDAFGIIAMIVGGLGWGRPVELAEPRGRANRSRYLTSLLAGPVADMVIGIAMVATYALLAGAGLLSSPRGGEVALNNSAAFNILGIAGIVCLAIGVLYLVPLPPLDGARIMWALAPPTPGWQKARYNLEEQNYGLGALVILSLPIFGGSEGLIVRLVYAVAQPIAEAVRNVAS